MEPTFDTTKRSSATHTPKQTQDTANADTTFSIAPAQGDPNNSTQSQSEESIHDMFGGATFMNESTQTTTANQPGGINGVQNNAIGTPLKGVTSTATPSLQKHMNELKELTTMIQGNHPDWDQSRILSELRKVDYGSDDGELWSMAMPFNNGDSQLTAAEQQEFQRIREDMIQQDDLDIGHVLVSMDVQQSLDIIEDSHASWAGDLGTAAEDAYIAGTSVRLGTGSATVADLMGDIDGDNIANHMEKGHEMDALFNYYLGQGQHCDGKTINDRFSTFSADLNLLDETGAMKSDAADLIEGDITSFFYMNNFKNNVKGISEGELLNGEFIPTSDIPDLIEESAKDFVEMIDQGIQQEQSMQTS